MGTVEELLIATPRGFCAGVEMAIKALAWMLRIFDSPVYCYHEIVHNRAVVAAFEAAGVVFVEDVTTVPPGAPLMLSAHGSAPRVVVDARDAARFVVDAVCPLVTKVHHEVKVRARKGYEIIYVGHEGHDEAVGTLAVAPASMRLVEHDTELADLPTSWPTSWPSRRSPLARLGGSAEVVVDPGVQVEVERAVDVVGPTQRSQALRSGPDLRRPRLPCRRTADPGAGGRDRAEAHC